MHLPRAPHAHALPPPAPPLPPPPPRRQSIKLSNPSKLPAKFEVVPQEASSTGLATYTVEPSSGGVPALGEQGFEVLLTTHTLGRVQLPLRVRVVGSKAPPLEFPIGARSMGPTLLFGTVGQAVAELGPGAAIAFEKVEVLETHTRSIQVRARGGGKGKGGVGQGGCRCVRACACAQAWPRAYGAPAGRAWLAWVRALAGQVGHMATGSKLLSIYW